MRRNLIYVSCLDDKNIHYEFGNRKWIIKFNEIDVGLAIKQDKLYLLQIVIMWRDKNLFFCECVWR